MIKDFIEDIENKIDSGKKIKLKTIAKYLELKFPLMKVKLSRIEGVYKTSKPAGFRYTTSGGTREYVGYRLIVEYKGHTIIDHDSTETYRNNEEVIRKVSQLREGFFISMVNGKILLEDL